MCRGECPVRCTEDRGWSIQSECRDLHISRFVVLTRLIQRWMVLDDNWRTAFRTPPTSQRHGGLRNRLPFSQTTPLLRSWTRYVIARCVLTGCLDLAGMGNQIKASTLSSENSVYNLTLGCKMAQFLDPPRLRTDTQQIQAHIDASVLKVSPSILGMFLTRPEMNAF